MSAERKVVSEAEKSYYILMKVFFFRIKFTDESYTIRPGTFLIESILI